MNEVRVAGQQSVRRACDVLFCLEAEDGALTAAEVAARLGMNRTTAWRYLQTLAGVGLAREVDSGRFALGARAVSLAESWSRQWGELLAVAAGPLVQLRDAVGETAALHVRQGWSRVVIRQVESRHELHRTYRDMGRPIPLHVGAPSLAILAALAPTEQCEYLTSHAGADESSRRELEEQLATVRHRGWALSRGARVPDVASVAVPLREPSGRVLGAINVTGPQERVLAADPGQLAEAIGVAVSAVERRLAEVAPGPRRA